MVICNYNSFFDIFVLKIFIYVDILTMTFRKINIIIYITIYNIIYIIIIII